MQIAYSQDNKKNIDNTISINAFLILETPKIDFKSYHKKGIMVNYSRMIYNKNLFQSKLQIGIGYYDESLGELTAIYGALNTSLFLKNYIGTKHHFGFIGLGLEFAPSYNYTYFLLPIGYLYQFRKNLFFDLSFNPMICHHYAGNNDYGDYKVSNWFWEVNYNDIWLTLGCGYNF